MPEFNLSDAALRPSIIQLTGPICNLELFFCPPTANKRSLHWRVALWRRWERQIFTLVTISFRLRLDESKPCTTSKKCGPCGIRCDVSAACIWDSDHAWINKPQIHHYARYHGIIPSTAASMRHRQDFWLFKYESVIRLVVSDNQRVVW